uniref:Uncharacterized protein n=1 Tax=Vitis vinifera TaxID=29760 RepID=A5CAE1_VITVI|nr:hypothetical protein VITISV_021997 [Vitis vinifera]
MVGRKREKKEKEGEIRGERIFREGRWLEGRFSSTIHLLRILHSRRLSLDGRGGRFNFPGQTCPDPPVTLIRRTSAANDSDSPDSLAHQTLTTRRIHFRPQSKSIIDKNHGATLQKENSIFQQLPKD